MGASRTTLAPLARAILAAQEQLASRTRPGSGTVSIESARGQPESVEEQIVAEENVIIEEVEEDIQIVAEEMGTFAKIKQWAWPAETPIYKRPLVIGVAVLAVVGVVKAG